MLAWKQPFIQRVRNSSLVEGRGIELEKVSVGEHTMCVEWEGTTDPGAHGKANVGISNDKEGEIPSRRKTKVSRAMSIIPGSVGS